MKKLILNIVLIVLIISCQNKFNRYKWIEKSNNTLTKIENPRKAMIKDLLSNYLFVKMSKDSIIKLLGKPYKDTIICYVPKNIKKPDSLKNIYKIKNVKKKEKVFDELNNWYNKNCIRGRYLIYPIGWSTIDPVFLEIEIDKSEKVKKFYVHKS